MEGRALPDLVIVVPQRVRRTFQQRCQPALAVHQRLSHQVLAVQKQQVEEEKDQRPLTGIARVLDQVEGRATIGQHPAKFAVTVDVPRRQPSNTAMVGYLSVQLFPRRVRICTLSASSRACIRYPSNLISCSQSGPSGAFSTSLASCGLIQVGGEGSSTLRWVGVAVVGFVRADFAIWTIYRNFVVLSVY
jgi:hypothetical protein